MRTIDERTVLLRLHVELPIGLKMATDEFGENWNFVRSGNGSQLEKKLQNRGWHFIKVADVLVGSGVGKTAQAAVAGALKLALCRVNEYFNGVEIKRIQLTEYPWFVLARVSICRYRIQANAVMPAADENVFQPVRSPLRATRAPSTEIEPLFAGAMPLLKEMFASPQSAVSRPE